MVLSRRESLIIALVLKDLGVTVADKVLAEKVQCARALVDHMLQKSEQVSEQAQPIEVPGRHDKYS